MRTLFQSRGRLIFFGCMLIAGYFVYTAVSGYTHSERINTGREEAAARVQQLQQKESYLEAIHKYVASDAYVEQVARRQLGYIREGEIPFVVTSPPLNDAQQPSGEWWERLFPR
jgi:cell division protein FtsB